MAAPALSARYRRHEDVVTREILGETLLVPISNTVADMDHIFALNDSGAFVWGRLDGETALAAIVEELAAAFEVDGAQAAEDVRGLLAELAEAGLVHAD